MLLFEYGQLNQQLLGEIGSDIGTFRGASARMYDWGDRAQHSAAAYEIISQANKVDQLNILALGAFFGTVASDRDEPQDLSIVLDTYEEHASFGIQKC